MKKIIQYVIKIAIILLITGIYLFAQEATVPEKAMLLLKEGNERFVRGERIFHNQDSSRRAITASQNQSPFATVLSCSDSRIPPEIIFDRGIGDLFIIRIPANIVSSSQIGASEYAIDKLRTPLYIVMGHEKCGFITSRVNKEKFKSHLSLMEENVKVPVEKAKELFKNSNNDEIISAAVRANVYYAIEKLLTKSEIVRQYVKSGKLAIEAAIYNMETGKVEWLGRHPNEKALINAIYEPFDAEKSTQLNGMKAVDTGFFNNSNIYFMIIFIVFCSLISAAVIFMVIFIKTRNRRPAD